MDFEYSYVVVIVMLSLIGLFYISPYELTVSEDDDE